jgi:hypothetical protein
MSVTLTRTRQALGSQLRDALVEMVERKQIETWTIVQTSDGRNAYRVTDAYGRTDDLSPGDLMSWVNLYGYDVRIGKA